MMAGIIVAIPVAVDIVLQLLIVDLWLCLDTDWRTLNPEVIVLI